MSSAGALAIYVILALLVFFCAYEWLRSYMFAEGFTDGTVPEFFGRFFPRRYDVVPGVDSEGDGWVRNPRYSESYVDLQRLGYKGDFCRVVERSGAPETRMVACALAGQEGLDSFVYRTDSARAGMRFSRDDYYRDVNGDGRDDYCRILKVSPAPHDRWDAVAVLGDLTRFKSGAAAEIPDNNPPPQIADLLWFFEGAMVWYRWFDDMLDYAENATTKIAGGASVDETPRRTVTKGLGFNRLPAVLEGTPPSAEQYLKIGENPRLEFDTRVELRQLRAVSVWVYFDEFSNNARIFDFGNGAGRDNILLGIEGRGNVRAAFGFLRSRPNASNAVCAARAAPETTPQIYMATSDANVDFWSCPGPEPVDSTYPEDELDGEDVEPTANLLFEIWDSQQRKMRIRVLDVIPLKKWVHIALTTTDGTSIRPTWHVYVNGSRVHEEIDGHLGQKSYTASNYIGRSNWEGVSSQYEDADERFRGAMFDFRMYRAPMSAAKITRTVTWGREKLDILKTKNAS